MPHIVMFRYSWLALCVVLIAVTAEVGLAGSAPGRYPAFTGQLAGEAPPPAEPLSLWYRQPATA